MTRNNSNDDVNYQHEDALDLTNDDDDDEEEGGEVEEDPTTISDTIMEVELANNKTEEEKKKIMSEDIHNDSKDDDNVNDNNVHDDDDQEQQEVIIVHSSASTPPQSQSNSPVRSSPQHRENDDDDLSRSVPEATSMSFMPESMKQMLGSTLRTSCERFTTLFPTTATSTNNNNINNKRSNYTGEADAGEEIVQRLLREAQYEIQVDPYRGIVASIQQESTNDADVTCTASATDDDGAETTADDGSLSLVLSPWRQCQVGSTYVGAADHEGSSPAAAEAEETVIRYTKSNCPCLKQWTESSSVSARKERKSTFKKPVGRPSKQRQQQQQQQQKTESSMVWAGKDFGNIDDNHPPCELGLRPIDSNFKCRCDYNPFCLLTLGGIVNDLLYDEASPTANDDDDAASASTDNDMSDAEISKADRRGRILSFSPNELSLDHPLGLFRSRTRMKLQEIRGSIDVNEDCVKSYLQQTLRSLTSIVSVEQGLQILKKRHEILIFTSPLVESTKQQQQLPQEQLSSQGDLNDSEVDEVEPPVTSTMIRMALPPGIENLGGTCYLNTLLQCLAQCLGFCEGLFSWEPSDSSSTNQTTTIDLTASQSIDVTTANNHQTDKRQAALKLFQLLLAQLHVGSRRAITTIEFSNTVGLDHHEQQDPNEFSRLFLEVMEQFFRASNSNNTNAASSNNSKYNLSDLLSHLFQGQMRYETACLECQSKSNRDEDFRDLNLPIVNAPTRNNGGRATAKKKGQQTLSSLFDRPDTPPPCDPSLQDCLDAYCQAEQLEGDNQYWCDQCQCKCDATRQVCFTQLPPVLNIQLSRYYYNRISGNKEKRSDPVRLPRELLVSCSQPIATQVTSSPVSCTSDEAREEETRRYVLCAVMRHLGTSAQRGHYVAEAQDWLTGQWFEFNDERVTHLPLGPTCSYHPREDDSHRSAANRSTDNTGGKAQNGTRKWKRGTFGSASGRKKASEDTKASSPGSKDAYNMYYVEERFLAQSVMENLRRDLPIYDSGQSKSTSVLDRVATERDAAYSELKRMCEEDGEERKRQICQRRRLRSTVFNDLAILTLVPTEAVWVHGETLREYANLDFADAITPRTSFLCSHEPPGLHPRIARQGKMLPKELFVMLRDRKRSWYTGSALDIRDMGEREHLGTIVDPTQNVACACCRKEYLAEMMVKYEKLSSLKRLHDLLDTKQYPEVALELSSGERITSEEDRYVYILARSFVSRFRKRFSTLVKSLVKSEVAPPSADNLLSDTEVSNIAEGLDTVPLAALCFDNEAESSREEDAIAPDVNACFLCPHRRFNGGSKRLYRYVPHATWQIIKSLFPDAHPIRQSRLTPGMSVTDARCFECEAENHAEDLLSQRIKSLVDFNDSNGVVPLEMKAVVESEQAKDTSDSFREYRIVHKDDIEAWKRFLRTYKRTGRAKKGEVQSESIKALLSPSTQCIRPLYTLSSQDSLDPIDDFRLETLSSLLRPITCSRHGRPTHRALFGDEERDDNNIGCRELQRRLVFLESKKYQEFLTNLATLVIMLSPSEAENPTHVDDSAAAKNFVARFELDQLLHPSMKRCLPGTPSSQQTNVTRVCGSSEGLGMKFELLSKVCTDRDCNDFFATWDIAEYGGGSCSQDDSAKAPQSESLSNMLVDSDVEVVADPGFSLRVFEVDAGVQVQEQLSNITDCAGVDWDDSLSNELGLRRSRRRRKVIFPVGAVINEDSIPTRLDANVAALRLLLLERCSSGSTFELNHCLKLLFRTSVDVPTDSQGDCAMADGGESNSTSAVALLDLPCDWNTRTLRELCENHLGRKLSSDFKPNLNVFLVRQSEVDPTFLHISQEDLMETLIGQSNSINSDASRPPRSKARSARERGFTGTLLSASLSMQPSTSDFAPKLAELTIDPSTPFSTIREEYVSVTENGDKPSEQCSSSPSSKRRKAASLLSGDDSDADESNAPKPIAKIPKRRASSPTTSRHADEIATKELIQHLMFGESSDENDEVLTTPAVFLKGNCRSNDRTKATTSTRSRFRLSKKSSSASFASNSATGPAYDRDARVVRLVAHLRSLPDFHSSLESQSLEAANWAVNSNPSEYRWDALETLATYKFSELRGLYRH